MKIGIVSCGFGGNSGGFAIALEGEANELICVDLDADLAKRMPKIFCMRRLLAKP